MKTLKKTFRGYLFLITLKVLLISAFFFIQSCEKGLNPENLAEKELALQQFQTALLDKEIDLKSIIESQSIGKKRSQQNSSNHSEEKQAEEVLSPLIDASYNLLEVYELADISISKNSLEQDRGIILLSLILFSEEISSSEKADASNELMIFSNYAYAQNWSKLGKCASKAFGVDDIADFRNWKTMGKKAQKKLLRKVATKLAARYVSSWIGVAIIVGEFTLCMY